jgi:hypothetical protein
MIDDASQKGEIAAFMPASGSGIATLKRASLPPHWMIDEQQP